MGKRGILLFFTSLNIPFSPLFPLLPCFWHPFVICCSNSCYKWHNFLPNIISLNIFKQQGCRPLSCSRALPELRLLPCGFQVGSRSSRPEKTQSFCVSDEMVSSPVPLLPGGDSWLCSLRSELLSCGHIWPCTKAENLPSAAEEPLSVSAVWLQPQF